jgi:hypothetical protein
MPYGIEHGVGGLESIHRLNNRFDMNLQGVMPRVKIDRITGLHSLPDADDIREKNYGRAGEIEYTSLYRGRTVVYEGRCQAMDLLGLRWITRTFREAGSFGHLHHGSIHVYPPAAIGGVTFLYEPRILSLEIDDEWTRSLHAVPSPYQREFILTVRSGDPRYFAVGMDQVYGPAADGQWVAVNNPGNAVANPVFVYTGPATGTVTFERAAGNFLARKMVYREMSLSSGQQAILDFKNRKFTLASDGSDLDYLRVFDDSNWWNPGAAGLNIGVSTVRVSGGSGSWMISFPPASW